MIKYPFNKRRNFTINSTRVKNISNANRGMELEEEINITNDFYSNRDMCLVTKRPCPIKILKLDYSSGSPKICDGYFEKQSTTDYNGVYKGRYIDFEAKSTMSKTSFPLANIPYHQIRHLKKVNTQGGIAFFIIKFVEFDETYLVDSNVIISFIESNTRKSIPYIYIKEKGNLIEKKYMPRLDYLPVVEKVYFS